MLSNTHRACKQQTVQQVILSNKLTSSRNSSSKHAGFSQHTCVEAWPADMSFCQPILSNHKRIQQSVQIRNEQSEHNQGDPMISRAKQQRNLLQPTIHKGFKCTPQRNKYISQNVFKPITSWKPWSRNTNWIVSLKCSSQVRSNFKHKTTPKMNEPISSVLLEQFNLHREKKNMLQQKCVI